MTFVSYVAPSCKVTCSVGHCRCGPAVGLPLSNALVLSRIYKYHHKSHIARN